MCKLIHKSGDMLGCVEGTSTVLGVWGIVGELQGSYGLLHEVDARDVDVTFRHGCGTALSGSPPEGMGE